MPRYDYSCDSCGRTFEQAHSIHADGPSKDADCDEPDCDPARYKRQLTTAPIIIRPSGYNLRAYPEDPEWKASPDAKAYWDFEPREDRPSWAASGTESN